MTSIRRLSAIGVASAIVSMVVVSACAQTTMPSATGATYGVSANPSTSPIEAIRQAPDPSAAIEAYAKGVAVEPATDTLREAFIQRMIEFGVPAMAESQARELVNRRPNKGLAWAVLAYANAARGQLTAAVENISHAVNLLPNDEFVQRTAGQLLAWYDTMADLPKVPDATKQTVQRVRTKMTDKTAFNETYQEALAFYKSAQQAQTEPQAQTTEPSGTAGPEQTYVTPPPQSTTYQEYNYVVPYQQPYVYTPYTYYPYYAYPYYTYPYGYYDSFFVGSFVPDFCLSTHCVPFTHCFPRSFFHHGFHDHGFGFHHGFHKGFHHGFHHQDGKFGFGFGDHSRGFGFSDFGRRLGERFGLPGFRGGSGRDVRPGSGFGNQSRGSSLSDLGRRFGERLGLPGFGRGFERGTRSGSGLGRSDAFSSGRGRSNFGFVNPGTQGRATPPGFRGPTVNRGQSPNRSLGGSMNRGPSPSRPPQLTTPRGNAPSPRSGFTAPPRQPSGTRQFSSPRPPSGFRPQSGFRSGGSSPRSFNRSFSMPRRSPSPAFGRSFGGSRSSGPAFRRSFGGGRSSGGMFRGGGGRRGR